MKLTRNDLPFIRKRKCHRQKHVCCAFGVLGAHGCVGESSLNWASRKRLEQVGEGKWLIKGQMAEVLCMQRYALKATADWMTCLSFSFLIRPRCVTYMKMLYAFSVFDGIGSLNYVISSCHAPNRI